MPLLPAEHTRAHAKVSRPLTTADLSHHLRKHAPPTTSHTWVRAQLPPERASAGAGPVEKLGVLFVVCFCWLPVVVIDGSLTSWILAGLTLAGTDLLLRLPRVVVGEDYVAVRRTGRFHVAHLDHTTHLELRPNEHGGSLRVHTNDGHFLAIRRTELARPRVSAALKAFVGLGLHTYDPQAEEVLMLDLAPLRVQQTYLPGSDPR